LSRPSTRSRLADSLSESHVVVDRRADAVVVAYQSADVIVDCVLSLDRDPAVDRIFVVNNSRGDGTKSALKDIARATYLEPDENIGFGNAVNLVQGQCRNDYVVLANPDATQSGATVSKATEFLDARPRAAVVGPRMLSPDGTLYRNSQHSISILRMVAERIGWPEKLRVARSHSEHETAHPTDYVIGSFLICRRAALDAVGWFDSSIFLFGEDQDICRRLRSARWEVWYAPLGEVVHESGHSWKQLDDEGREWFRRARPREVKAEIGLLPAAIYSMLEKLSRSSRS
jgi:N-acetylglucosaminyl-diphospho-decaprenol L-rhamnosyltransferase